VIDAGSDLTLSALNGIDILALNHADAQIASGGDLSLQSDGIISGDAHYLSIGNFIIAPITPGQATSFVSSYDPIVKSTGNVLLDANYEGESLKIETSGNIVTRNITIADKPAVPIAGDDPELDLLNNFPTLILKAGGGAEPVADSNNTNGSGNIINATNTPASISTGAIAINAPDGRVLLQAPGAITTKEITLTPPFSAGADPVVAISSTQTGDVTTGAITAVGGNIRLFATDGDVIVDGRLIAESDRQSEERILAVTNH
jgi:hypothetical protein